MIEFLAYTLIIAFVAAWVLSLGYKWGVVEALQIHAPNEFFEKLFSCNFCMSWWIGVALSVATAVVVGDASVLLCPFATTIITKRLVE